MKKTIQIEVECCDVCGEEIHSGYGFKQCGHWVCAKHRGVNSEGRCPICAGQLFQLEINLDQPTEPKGEHA